MKRPLSSSSSKMLPCKALSSVRCCKSTTEPMYLRYATPEARDQDQPADQPATPVVLIEMVRKLDSAPQNKDATMCQKNPELMP
jgi:hypothetical protein